MKYLTRLAVLIITLLIGLSVCGEQSASWPERHSSQPPIHTDAVPFGPLSAGSTASQLAAAILTPDTASFLVSSSLSGSNVQAEVLIDSLQGFPILGNSYAVLSTGIAADTPGSAGDFMSVDVGGPFISGGSPEGYQAYDVVTLTLRLNLPSNAENLTFSFKFGTEENPDYLNSPYQDFFTATLRDSSGNAIAQIARLPNNRIVTVDNAAVYSNAVGGWSESPTPPFPSPNDTVYNAVTSNVLTASCDITSFAGSTISIVFQLGDASDQVYDSVVFIDNLCVTTIGDGKTPEVTRWEITNLWEVSNLRAFLAQIDSLSGYLIDCMIDVYVTNDELIKEIGIKLSTGEFKNLIKEKSGHYRLHLRIYKFSKERYLNYLSLFLKAIATYFGYPTFSIPAPEHAPEVAITEITICDDKINIHHITQSKAGQTLPERLRNYEGAMNDMIRDPWSTHGGTIFSTHCPADLLVEDLQGRRIGALYESGVFNREIDEIPDAFYVGQGLDFQLIYVPGSFEDYTVEVIGTDTGEYILDVLTFREEESGSFTAIEAPTTSGAVHQYTIDWDTLAQGKEGVTLKIDTDGDGIFERTITADDKLIGEEFGVVPTEQVINHGPNPVLPVGCVFWLNLPDDTSSATINIFDIDGAGLVDIPLDPIANRYPQTGRWLPQDDQGRLLGTGLYLYVVKIKHTDGTTTYSPVQKMVIQQ